MIKEISIMRDLSPQTIENHLFKAYKEGYTIVWEIFFNKQEEETILRARKEIDEPKLKALKEAIDEEYSYTKIKAVLVKNDLA